MLKISAVIITFNEDKYIRRCLESLKGVADEILVVDSRSTDNTREICLSHNVKFIEHDFEGYREQKNWAMNQAENDIILSLDGDEYLSEELRNSILSVGNNTQPNGYYINRRNNFYGKWMKHSGVYPDKKLRLFDRRKGEWGGINPHDVFRLNKGSKIKRLKGDLMHTVYDSVEEHKEKNIKFSEISAREYVRLGKRSCLYHLIIHPLWRFIRSYFIRFGFLDGKTGLKVCYYNAQLSYLKHKKIISLLREGEKV